MMEPRWGKNIPDSYPNGVKSHSPGLDVSSYPWVEVSYDFDYFLSEIAIRVDGARVTSPE